MNTTNPRLRRRRYSVEPIVFNIVNIGLLLILCIVMIYPILNTLAISLNEAKDSVKGGIYLLPRKWTLYNYQSAFAMDTMYSAFWISVAKTVVQVVTNLFFTSMLAYTISRREYVLAKPITVIFVLTMYFSAGLIPNYLLIKNLGLLQNFNVYWIPNIISAFNLIVMRTQIRMLPESLIESAKIDGAGEFRIYVRIILPLIVPTMATIALFVAVGSWNSWFDTMIYADKISVLQYELQKLLAAATNVANGTQPQPGLNPGDTPNSINSLSIRATVSIIAAVPILIVYPFLQRYFVTGLTIGGVKE